MDGKHHPCEDDLEQLPDLNLTLSSIDYDAPILARSDCSQVTHAHGNKVPCSCNSQMTNGPTRDDENCGLSNLEHCKLEDVRETKYAAGGTELGSLASSSKPLQQIVELKGSGARHLLTPVESLLDKSESLRRSNMEQTWPSMIAPPTNASQQAAFPEFDPQSWIETLQWLRFAKPASGGAAPSFSERGVDSLHHARSFDTCPPTTQSFNGYNGAPHTGSSCDADNVFYDFLASSSDNFPSTQACNAYDAHPRIQLTHLRYDAHMTPGLMEHPSHSRFQVPRFEGVPGPSTIHGAVGPTENIHGHGAIMQGWEGALPASTDVASVTRRNKLRGMKRPLNFEGVGERRPFTLTTDATPCQHHMPNGDGESNGQRALTYEPKNTGDRSESRGRISSPVATLESGGPLPVDLDQELQRLQLQMLPVSATKSSSPPDAEDGGAADRWGGEDGEIMDRPHVGEVGTADAASNESEGDSYPSKGGGEGAREVQARLEVVKSHYQKELQHLTEQEELTCRKVVQAASEPPPMPSRMPWAVTPALSLEELGQRLAAVRGLYQTSHKRLLDIFRRDCTAIIAGSSGGRGDRMSNRRFNLPKHAVQAMRSWLFSNFLVPYPGEKDKRALSCKTGLTPSQVFMHYDSRDGDVSIIDGEVNNWFINARVRLWRPLLEELCCELRQDDHDFRHVKRKLFVLRPEEHGSAVQGN